MTLVRSRKEKPIHTEARFRRAMVRFSQPDLKHVHPHWSSPLTIDEELTLLEENVRRLKVEYDIFFGGGSKKPPADVEWRVQNLLKKYSDSGRLNFAQRFRFNTIQQRYALFSALWQQKLKIKE